jgi:glycosyltransferase involved in cell wall biosynthesis
MMFVASTLRMGGAERGTFEVARRLSEEGWRIEVVCLREPGVVGEMFERSGIRVTSGLCEGARDPRAFTRLHAFFRDRRAHAVYFLDHTNAVFWGAPAAWLAGVPARLMVVHTTGLWGGGSSLPLGVRAAMPFLSRVIATAKGQADYLREVGVPAHKLVLIRNGVETARTVTPEARSEIRRELGLGADDLAVGMIAMLRPEKAHEILLSAASRLKDAHPRMRIFLIGDGPRREELVTAASSMGLTGIVRFLGLRPDAPRLAAAFDVVVLTSHPLVETLPYSLLEAEIVEEGGAGILVPPHDADAFADALGAVLGDGELRRRLGSQGRRWVAREFSVERVVRETASLVHELAGES